MSTIKNFRRGLIAKLPDFNELLLNHGNRDLNFVDNIVNKFTGIIREIADPLFKKTRKNVIDRLLVIITKLGLTMNVDH
jgi:hypothetical protein